MKLKYVTITGADDNTGIKDLLNASKHYPFVEWGILFSPNPERKKTDRYPSKEWCIELAKASNTNKLNLSAHLCGGYTKEMLEFGQSHLVRRELGNLLKIFKRAQLNFNASSRKVDLGLFYNFLTENQMEGRNFIIQHNKANKIVLDYLLQKNHVDVHFLYDSSGGRGTIPQTYQGIVPNYLTGYSGGLSPDNLEDCLFKIKGVVADSEIWIDTETGVRTDDKLDMDKVISFLDRAKKFA
ncbi:MAG: hypothetical protein V4547_17615 [Bacteroidota bacterium]